MSFKNDLRRGKRKPKPAPSSEPSNVRHVWGVIRETDAEGRCVRSLPVTRVEAVVGFTPAELAVKRAASRGQLASLTEDGTINSMVAPACRRFVECYERQAGNQPRITASWNDGGGRATVSEADDDAASAEHMHYVRALNGLYGLVEDVLVYDRPVPGTRRGEFRRALILLEAAHMTRPRARRAG